RAAATRRPLPGPTLFPYTTLFRSAAGWQAAADRRPGALEVVGRQQEKAEAGVDQLGIRQRVERLHPRDPAGEATLATGLGSAARSEEHTSELQSRENLVCRLLLEK